MSFQIVDGKAVKTVPQPDVVQEFTLAQLQEIRAAKVAQRDELNSEIDDLDTAIAALE